MLTTAKTAQELHDFYSLVWDVAIPTIAELHIMFSALGQVREAPTKRFPRAFTLLKDDGQLIPFLDREQAWHWYTTVTGLYTPIVLPWKLPHAN